MHSAVTVPYTLYHRVYGKPPLLYYRVCYRVLGVHIRVHTSKYMVQRTWCLGCIQGAYIIVHGGKTCTLYELLCSMRYELYCAKCVR